MVKCLFPLLILLTFFSACKETTYEFDVTPQQTIKVDVEKDLTATANFLDVIKTVDVVKLDSNDGFIVSNIDKLNDDGSYFYLIDKPAKSQGKFCIFDKQGKGIKVLNSGRGPGEFNRLADFILLKDTIAILDGYSSKVLYYDKKGNFLGDFKGNPLATKLGLINNHIAMFNANRVGLFSDDNVAVYDTKGHKIASFMRIHPKLKDKSIYLGRATDYFLDELLYVNPYANDIYTVYKDSIRVKYHIDFGKYSLDMGVLNENDMRPPVITFLEKGMVFSLSNFCETSGYLTFPFIAAGKGNHYFYYDKVRRRKMLFNLGKSPNWLNRLSCRYFLYSDRKENVFISPLSLFDLKEELTDKDYQEMEKTPFKTLIPYIKNASIKDNIYLLRYTLK